MEARSVSWTRPALLVLALLALTTMGSRCTGLSPRAFIELHVAGVDRYVGAFEPAVSEDAGNGWEKHTFDTEDGEGPICINGTEFTAFSRERDPRKVLIFLDGGGACWQDFYFCSFFADQDAPPEVGIFADEFDTGSEVIENPLADYSIVAGSYCDGSVWSGDNVVEDPNFPLGEVRYHRGLRNLSATIDLARKQFPQARKVIVSGASAGGVGAAGFAPFVTRFAYGNRIDLQVFNDAGPIAINNAPIPPIQEAIAARAADWQFEQFYPASCTDCAADAQATEIVKWRLAHDNGVREAFYSTDGDSTNRFFLAVPDQLTYRALLLSVHGEVNDAFPFRYKRFIRSGDDSHTALGTPLYYVGTANGTPLHEWTEDFAERRPGWVDIVEDFVPLP